MKAFCRLLIIFLLLNIFSFQSFAENTLCDTKGHWAESSIDYLYKKGIINGTAVADKWYIQPNKLISRAEFVSTLAKVKPFTIKKEKVIKFKDISDNAEYKDAIDKLTSNSIINGYEDNTFGPEKLITRAEIAAIIARAMDWEKSENINESTKFSDVESKQWHYKCIMVNKSKGIIGGYPDGSFGPDKNASKAEVYTMFAKMMKNYIGNNENNEAKTLTSNTVTPSTNTTNTNSKAGSEINSANNTKKSEDNKINNPSGIIAYKMDANSGSKAYFQVFAFGLKEMNSFNFSIDYDSSKIIAAKVIKGVLSDGNYIESDLSSASKGVVKVGSSSLNGFKESGTIFTVVFDILPDVSGKTDININGGIKNSKGDLIQPFSIQNGSITIK